LGRKLQNLPFEQWVASVFNHPVAEIKNAWYWDIHRDWWEESPADPVQFLTQEFEHAADVFRSYSFLGYPKPIN
jgi:hypothetical protein